MRKILKNFLALFLSFVGILLLSHSAYASSLTIGPFSNASIQTGENYVASLSFTDSSLPFGGIWGETVDFGDGSGIQSFSLPSQNPFYISHLYTVDGIYTVTVSITDSLGVTATTSATVNVSASNPPFSIDYWNNSLLTNAPMPVNSTYSALVYFTDPRGPSENDTAVYNWGDGSTSQAIISPDYAGANTNSGFGSAYGTHTYTQAGVYTITITMTDPNGVNVFSQLNQYIVVYDASAGFVTGSGTYTSQPGWDTLNPSATGQVVFGVSAKYVNDNTNPTGTTKLMFKVGDLTFSSTAYSWLVVNAGKAYLMGTGTINGSGNYTFFISAIDGSQIGGQSFIRVKITDPSNNNNVIYDTQLGAANTADPTTPLTQGSIKVH